jgi:hypothetical protein
MSNTINSMYEIFKLFGLFSIGAGLIVSVIGFIGKKVIEQIFNKDLEKFKNNLQSENEKTKLKFEIELESFRADLNLLYSKQINLYSKKSEIIENLYQKLVELNATMLDMTAMFRNITGKDEQTVQKEELERVNSAAEKGNDFFNFYNYNKIYFEIETCLLIQNLQQQFREVHSDFSFTHTFGLPPSEMTYDMAKKGSERVRTDIPKLLEKLEEDFRKTLGVINEGMKKVP